jgi:TonB-dependent receptor
MLSLNRLFFSLLIFLGFTVNAQNASLSGKVQDSKTNEALFGVKVILTGTGKGAVTDGDGNFAIKGLIAGKYTLEVRYETYNNLILQDINVKEGENLAINIPLDKVVMELGQVTVTAKVNKDSNTELLRLQRNSATVVDGINAETFKKTPDSKASDVFKRITGASVQDNKFVVIRGLNDRYNFGLINGAPLPSSESDRKAFSFDIFPSNMLDNLIISKTATPDQPGEFAGGVIDISTSEPKEKDFQSIQIGGSYNTISTFKNFESYEGSKTDFLGFGQGARSLPTELPGTADYSSLNKDQKAEYAKSLTPSWTTAGRTAMPNLSLQYSLGRTYKIGETKSFGFVAAYSYQNNNSIYSQVRREFEEQATEVVKKMELNDTVYNNSVLNAGLLNFKFSINPKSNIYFKNMYSVSSEDKVNVRKGTREMDNDPKQFERSTNFWYTQNNLYTSQLYGKHEFEKTKFNWNVGFSNVSRQIPNLRRIVYRKYASTEEDTVEQYTAVIQQNGTIATAAGNMFWSNSSEQIYSAKYDFSRQLDFGVFKNELKIGAMHAYRNRDFTSRNFGFSQYKPNGSSFNSQLLLLPEDQIFNSENLGLLENGQGGFKLDEATNVDDNYQASSFLNAGFLMLDSKIAEKLRLVGGARLESYNQVFNYIEFGSNQEQRIDTTVIDVLPSVNLIYSMNKKMNLRASFYQTVSRPEFRELAPFTFYNFVIDNIISGSPDLQRAKISNADLRYEFFPGAGQIISVSGFYKKFNNPIELINRTGTSGAPELYYTNVKGATSYGVEAEYRMNLGFLKKNDSTSFLKQITLYANGSLIRSKVDLEGISGSEENRPLQGQSPYIVNAGLFYTNKEGDFSISASYNVVGQRIYIVGNVQEPSVWENGRNVIDFQIAKTFYDNKLELKLNIKDLLAQELVFFQDLNGNQKYDLGTDNAWQEVQFGQTISLSLKYNF